MKLKVLKEMMIRCEIILFFLEFFEIVILINVKRGFKVFKVFLL